MSFAKQPVFDRSFIICSHIRSIPRPRKNDSSIASSYLHDESYYLQQALDAIALQPEDTPFSATETKQLIEATCSLPAQYRGPLYHALVQEHRIDPNVQIKQGNDPEEPLFVLAFKDFDTKLFSILCNHYVDAKWQCFDQYAHRIINPSFMLPRGEPGSPAEALSNTWRERCLGTFLSNQVRLEGLQKADATGLTPLALALQLAKNNDWKLFDYFIRYEIPLTAFGNETAILQFILDSIAAGQTGAVITLKGLLQWIKSFQFPPGVIFKRNIGDNPPVYNMLTENPEWSVTVESGKVFYSHPLLFAIATRSADLVATLLQFYTKKNESVNIAFACSFLISESKNKPSPSDHEILALLLLRDEQNIKHASDETILQYITFLTGAKITRLNADTIQTALQLLVSALANCKSLRPDSSLGSINQDRQGLLSEEKTEEIQKENRELAIRQVYAHLQKQNTDPKSLIAYGIFPQDVLSYFTPADDNNPLLDDALKQNTLFNSQALTQLNYDRSNRFLFTAIEERAKLLARQLLTRAQYSNSRFALAFLFAGVLLITALLLFLGAAAVIATHGGALGLLGLHIAAYTTTMKLLTLAVMASSVIPTVGSSYVGMKHYQSLQLRQKAEIFLKETPKSSSLR